MTTRLFSINGAAEILERDRRTITKALSGCFSQM